jgi:hypothetical protein
MPPGARNIGPGHLGSAADRTRGRRSGPPLGDPQRAQRPRQIGLPVALDAWPLKVVWLFLRRTAVLLGLGVSFGTVGALVIGRLLPSFLIEIGPRDPLTLAAVAVVLGANGRAVNSKTRSSCSK